ncbi:MAG: hypothetical protein GX051_10155 [Clostridiales bacterium]|nr:hypothetical protein [Clostridiales bacterium]
MDYIRFQNACEMILNGERERSGIGTLSEKTLHAVLKMYFEPDNESREVKIGRYVADIVGENGIIEIQTRGFDKLRPKLAAFLDCTNVTIVYPIPRVKYLRWINPETGELSEKRKSPKTGRFYDAFGELYKIKPLLKDPNLHLCLVMLDVTEYRYLDGWSNDKKKGSSRCERIPDALIDELYINSIADYRMLVPAPLPELFTAKEYARAAHLTIGRARTALNVLSFVGAVIHVGKRGREYEYRRGEPVYGEAEVYEY